MNLHNNIPETLELLLAFLKDHEGKEIWFLLADGFIRGTLDRAPNHSEGEFTLIEATRYLANGEKQALDQVSLKVSQIIGWGGDSMDFIESED